MRKMNLRGLRSKKGMSLVEVVVALTVITIISAAALSLVISSARVDANSLSSTQIMMAAENALECFRFAQNDEDFTTLLKKTGDYSVIEGVCVMNEPSYVIAVDADYTNGKLTFTAIDSAGKEICTYEFDKG